MMDYVLLMKYIREFYWMDEDAAIVFGGSYGGNYCATQKFFTSCC